MQVRILYSKKKERIEKQKIKFEIEREAVDEPISML